MIACISIICFSLFAQESEPIAKRALALPDGGRLQLLMIPSHSDKKSDSHRLVLSNPSGRDEIVWATNSKERSATTTSVDVDNDYLQLILARLDNSELTVLLSTVLGVDVLRFEEKGGRWSLLTRKNIIPADERFQQLAVIAQGVVIISLEANAIAVWIESNGVVRRFGIVLKSVDWSSLKMLVEEGGSIIWVPTRGEKRILAGRGDALSRIPNPQPTGDGSDALMLVPATSPPLVLNKLPEPEPPVRVELKKQSSN